MENPSTAALAEEFRKRQVVLCENLERQEKLRTPSEAPATGLLSLPIEIRLEIYYYCIPRKRIIDVISPCLNPQRSLLDSTLDFRDAQGETGLEDDPDLEADVGLEGDNVHNLDLEDDVGDYWEPNKNRNSIFHLSKRVSEEALDVLYGDNVFKLHLNGNDEYYLKKNFSDRNRERMRYLLLIAQQSGAAMLPGKLVDEALWRSILPDLKGLRIVAEQPVVARGYYNAPTLEQDMDRWVNWFRPFLQYFGQYLSIRTNVQIDVNGQAETRTLIKESLPHGYQEIRCRYIGDLIFERGQFSWGSRYLDDDGLMTSRDADSYWDSE